MLLRWLFPPLFCSSCLFNSQWFEPDPEQLALQRLTPEQHHSPETAGPRLVRGQELRRQRVVVVATREYTSQVSNWEARFRANVAAANEILRRDVLLELEVVLGGFWQGGSESLPLGLQRLRREFPGQPGDLVVGLVQATSLLPNSFHKLGMAEVGGRHLVVRAANDAIEYDNIQRLFRGLSQQERTRLYSQRRTHRAATVLIHEIAHCFGARHSQGGADIMNANYDVSRSRLRPFQATQMREELTRRSGSRDRSANRPASTSGSRRPPSSRWRPQHGTVPSLQNTASSKADSDIPPAPSDSLPASQQAVVQRAQALASNGENQRAWKTIQPLFESHSLHPAVAELRCHLATTQGLAWDKIQHACAGFVQLNNSK